MTETIIHYPATEEINLQHVRNFPPVSNVYERENMADNSNAVDTPTQSTPVQDSSRTNSAGPSKTDAEDSDISNEDDTEEFVMDKIVNHRINKSKKHRYAEVGEQLYRIRWYNLGPADDTWEPISHIPRSKVLSYHRRKNLALPDNLDESIDG